LKAEVSAVGRFSNSRLEHNYALPPNHPFFQWNMMHFATFLIQAHGVHKNFIGEVNQDIFFNFMNLGVILCGSVI